MSPTDATAGGPADGSAVRASPPTPWRAGDLWAGVLVAAMGAIGLVASLQIFVPLGLADVLGPRTFPIVISMALIGLGIALAVRCPLQHRLARPDVGVLSTLAVLVAVVAGYVAVFTTVGFMLATAALLAALFRYLGERRLWVAVVVAVVLALAITVAFGTGLGVALPRGPLGL